MYHIPNDRAEERDLAKEQPEIVARLREKLAAWKAALPQTPPAHCISKRRK